MIIDNKLIIDSSDKNLVEKLNFNSTKAFEEIYKKYFKGLTLYASQYINLKDAESIVQDTMLWIWENRESVNKNLSLKSLLYTIVRNKTLNHLEHYKIRRRVFEELLKTTEVDYEFYDNFAQNGVISRYKKLLEDMPYKFKEAYLLNRNKKLTHNQIAEKLQVSIQTVNYRISQALKILRLGLSDFLILLLAFISYSIE